MLVTKINRVLQQIKARHADALAEHDVTPRQVYVLMAIADAKGAPSQTDLVEVTGVDRSTVSDILRRLSRKGLIKRERSKEDARAYKLKLTPDGQQKLKAAARAMTKVERIGGIAGGEELSAALDRCLDVPNLKLVAAE